MPRYFVEVSYHGQGYSGFQIQENANSVQAEVEKAYQILHRRQVVFTGSSRTDSGVHARQNFFHFDDLEVHEQFVYKMNALLPQQIAVKAIYRMPDSAHARFDAVARKYRYYLHMRKDPFLTDRSYFYPYQLDMELMKKATVALLGRHDFSSFSKSNSQVKSFECEVLGASWEVEEGRMIFEIRANRFLRGMVRLITGALLMVGRRRLTYEQFAALLEVIDRAGYSVPAKGLFLESVEFPANFFSAPGIGLSGLEG